MRGGRRDGRIFRRHHECREHEQNGIRCNERESIDTSDEKFRDAERKEADDESRKCEERKGLE